MLLLIRLERLESHARYVWDVQEQKNFKGEAENTGQQRRRWGRNSLGKGKKRDIKWGWEL